MALEYTNANFVKNALVFAPGKTILGALKEISDIPFEKILPPRFYKTFMSTVKITYTQDGEKNIPVITGSAFNVIVTNTEKIRIQKPTNGKSVQVLLNFKQKEKTKEQEEIDHVIVGPTGVFVIETKNWSDEYAFTADFSPLEQAARAGYLTYVLLRDKLGNKTQVNSLVASLKRNIDYDKKEFPYVYVCNPEKLTEHVLNRREILSEREVERIAKLMGKF